jgi:hypothetical protein
MKRCPGVLSLLFGLGLGTWIGYNHLIEMQHEAKGHNPAVAILQTDRLPVPGENWWRER